LFVFHKMKVILGIKKHWTPSTFIRQQKSFFMKYL